MSEPWFALLGPLPAGAVPERKPIATPEVLASRQGAAVAGWENVSLNLSSAGDALRHLLIVLDETGRPIAASDHVFFRWVEDGQPDEPAQIRQESIGGRLEQDGSFRGTCWVTTGPEPPDDEEPHWDMVSRQPSEDEAAALKRLVAELLDRLA